MEASRRVAGFHTSSCLFFSPPLFLCQIKHLRSKQRSYQQGSPQILWTFTVAIFLHHFLTA
jgi:hypothetical protein